MSETTSSTLANKAVLTDRTSIKTATVATGTGDKEPKWDTFTPFAFLAESNAMVETIKTTRSTLTSVSNTLEKIEDYVASAQEVLDIIALFEGSVKSILYSFLDILISQMQTMLNDVKSTGVYTLDLVDYHWMNNSDEGDVDNYNYLESIAQGAWCGLGGTAWQGDEEEADDSSMLSFLKAVNKSYKKETYYEFIETVAGAFEDDLDVPTGAMGYALAPEWLNNDWGYYETNSDGNKVPKNTDTPEKVYGVDIDPRIRSGRPDFGDESYMKIYLLAFAFSDIAPLVALVENISLIMNSMVEDAKKYTGLTAAADSTEDPTDKSDSTVFSNKNAKDKADKDDGGDGNDTDILGEVSKIFSYNQKYGAVQPSSSAPNFYGINMYTLFSPYFDYIQYMLNKCRSWSNKEIPGVGGLLETLSSWLDDLVTQIKRITDLITLIDNMIRMIETVLKVTGIRLLSFDTKYGISGITDGLRNSVNFGKTNSDSDAAKEVIRATKAASNIADLLEVKEEMADAYTDILERTENLNGLNTIVKEWNTYMLSEDYYTKAATVTTAQTAWENLIEIQETLIEDIEDSEEDIAGLTTKKETLDTEWDEANNGYYISDEFIDGYVQKIAEVTLERDELIADEADTSTPDIDDYADTLLSLNQELAGLETQQATALEEYNTAVSNYTWVQDAITEDTYDNQLTDASLDFTAIKNNNDELFAGSDAETFYDLDVSYTDIIDNLNTDIDNLSAELITANSGLNDATNAIYAYDDYLYMIAATDYPDGTTLPTTPAPWDETAFTDLFTTYWYYENRVADIPGEITTKQSEITTTEDLQSANITTWEEFSTDNIMYQYRYSLLIDVLNAEISKESIQSEIDTLTSNMTADLLIKNEEINTIIENGWDNYLSNTVIYYQGVLPYSTDGVVLGDWTDNVIGYLILTSAYNMTEPTMVGDVCPIIENALVAADADTAKALKNYETSKSAYDKAVEREEEKLSEVEVQENSSWSATDKMYYGGYLFAYGWPLNLLERSTKGISTLYKENFKDPLIADTNQLTSLLSESEIGKLTGKILNGMLG